MLCLTCDRVRPALNTSDYTTTRARLITEKGLCACTEPGPDPADEAKTADEALIPAAAALGELP